MCLFPKFVKNPKYKVNKKNGGNAPILDDKRKEFVPVGCGKCIECRKRKARDWSIRIKEDIKVNNNCYFVTLTYEDFHLKNLQEDVLNVKKISGYELDNRIIKLSVKRYRERVRKNKGKSLRYWLVSEIGGNKTERIHLHGIIWTNDIEDITKRWMYGMVCIGKRRYYKGKKMDDNTLGYVGEKSVNYIVKYLHKTDLKHKEYNPLILCSRGIGKNYLSNSNIKRHRKYKEDFYRNENGHKLSLPIYYRNNIFNEEEREQMWIEQLNKNVRYVLGEKIDVTNGYDSYNKIVKEARLKNNNWGYGNDKINYQRIKYENELRSLKAIERQKKDYKEWIKK